MKKEERKVSNKKIVEATSSWAVRLQASAWVAVFRASSDASSLIHKCRLFILQICFSSDTYLGMEGAVACVKNRIVDPLSLLWLATLAW